MCARLCWGAAALLALLAGCDADPPLPDFTPVGDQVAAVGVELTLELHASDTDGHSLTFDFDSPDLSDLKTRIDPATMTSFPNGTGVFRWSPTAADRSTMPYRFDFSVSDGDVTVSQTINMAVRDATAGAPSFIQPLGSGTTLDLARARCIQVPILIEDPTAEMVSIVEEAPVLPGAMLNVAGPFSATFSWCPTPAQATAADHYTAIFSASDDAPAKVQKSYVIVLAGALQP